MFLQNQSAKTTGYIKFNIMQNFSSAYSYVLIIIIIITSVFFLSCNAQSNKKDTTYKIEIRNMVYGRLHYSTMITNNSLIVFNDDFGRDSSKTVRILTVNEKQNMQKAIKELPLETLENLYINPAVSDGIQVDFFFEINGKTKIIRTSNKYQKDPGKFVKTIVKMLPSDHIGYNEKSLRH